MSDLPFRALTPLQETIAGCLCEGLTAQEIGESLNLSVFTVRNYIDAIAVILPGDLPPIRRIRRWYYRTYLERKPTVDQGAA